MTRRAKEKRLARQVSKQQEQEEWENIECNRQEAMNQWNELWETIERTPAAAK